MSNEPDPEYMHKSIEPKSDQLNADTLLTGPITVKIIGVKRGNQEQPVTVEIEGYPQTPYKPGKSMRRVLIAAWGDDPKKWIDHQLRLYCDPDVKFGGVKVGGIRISHMSHIDADRTFMLTSTRGKKSEFHVKRLTMEQQPKGTAETLTEADAEWIASATYDIEIAQSLDDLEQIGGIIATKNPAIKAAMKSPYVAKQRELKTPA